MIRTNKKFNTISFKISVLVAVACFVLIAVMVGRSIFTLKETEIASAKDNTLSTARDYAGRFKSKMEEAILITNTLSNAFLGNTGTSNTTKLSRDNANTILKDVLIQHKDLLGTWTIWEPNAFDGRDAEYTGADYHDSTGRFIPYWIRDGEKIYCEAVMHYEDENEGAFYNIPKKEKKEIAFGPFEYNGVFMVSMISPIVKNDKFYGVVGADISVNWIQNWVDEITLYEGHGKLNVIASDGTIAAAQGRKDLVGKNADALYALHTNIWNNLHKNGTFIVNDTLFTHVPLYIGKAEQPWQVSITVPLNVLTAGADIEMLKLVAAGFVLLLIIVSIVIYLSKKLINPIKDIAKAADSVAVGNFEYERAKANTTEIELLNKAFDKVVDSQKDITKVCSAIAKGDFTKKANVKSENDELAIAVNQMIENLKTASEEDKKRNWVSEGLAKFADILRSDKDMVKLSEAVISNLVKYVGLNQGWMFLLNDSDKNDIHLELTACYAYDRKKFVEKRIAIGEGLAGQCFLEKSSVYITQVPKDYVNITSGVGEATPSCMLIVPLMVNEKIEGVLELASFKKLEPFQIQFVEKLAESIASTISGVKINDRTKVLLEASQQQAEEMRAQEEEMRQNMEELQATQEEMHRKESEYLQEISLLKQELQEYRTHSTALAA